MADFLAPARPPRIAAARTVLLLCAILVPAIGTTARAQVTNPDALWDIVSTCVDDETSNYCACPAFARSCCGNAATPDADVVWARTDDLVAIRDMLMCGCKPPFVAGLALPRIRISGIGDPKRPEGIWPFAWSVAKARIRDERAIGLAINPRDVRTQNQMHVHLLRIRPEVRAWLELDPPAPPQGAIALPLANLDGVFAAVEQKVGTARMEDSGILVVRQREGGWLAVITNRTSPQLFTVNDCS